MQQSKSVTNTDIKLTILSVLQKNEQFMQPAQAKPVRNHKLKWESSYYCPSQKWKEERYDYHRKKLRGRQQKGEIKRNFRGICLLCLHSETAGVSIFRFRTAYYAETCAQGF